MNNMTIIATLVIMIWVNFFNFLKEGFKMENELNKFAVDNGIKIKSTKVFKNPNMEDSDKMDNFEVILTMEGNTFQIYYSKGTGLRSYPPGVNGMRQPHLGKYIKPTMAEVLECMRMDSFIEDYGFEEWAENLGYDTDSRKAERIYNQCVKQDKEFKDFLGIELYNSFMEIEEE